MRYRVLMFNDMHCAVTKMISVALVLHPGSGLALSEKKQWWSYALPARLHRR